MPAIAALLSFSLAAAACGGSSSASSTATTAAAGGSAGAVVSSGKTPAGTVLVDGQGRTLYLYTPDTSSASTCTGVCAATWPPLATQGAPQAKAGVDASKLGATTRSDGSKQVTYAGHPLYTFATGTGTAPGDLSGQGVGGIWYVVGVDGVKITTSAKAGTTTPPTGSSGTSTSGGGWG
jgi:predicted lipoprotein with Yx(FWY)xxD motif